jgi:hypothetical protein
MERAEDFDPILTKWNVGKTFQVIINWRGKVIVIKRYPLSCMWYNTFVFGIVVCPPPWQAGLLF